MLLEQQPNGTDYTDGLSSITVSAGDLTGTVSFAPTDDSTYEGNETAVIDIDTIAVTGSDAARWFSISNHHNYRK